MTQLEIVIESIRNLGGKAHYSDIYPEFEAISGTKLTPGRKAGIRKTIEDHSSDSMNFKNRGDYFYSVHGLGEGCTSGCLGFSWRSGSGLA